MNLGKIINSKHYWRMPPGLQVHKQQALINANLVAPDYRVANASILSESDALQDTNRLQIDHTMQIVLLNAK